MAGAVILAWLLWRVGSDPFLVALKRIDGWSLAAATGIAVMTTVCSAWRWTLAARGLGVALPLRSAVAASYRSQFLNVTLPGGVLGDVHRGVRHGREAGDLGRGLRSVAWERASGQAVQVSLTVAVLLLLSAPVRISWQVAVAVAAAAALTLALVAGLASHGGSTAPARAARAAIVDLRTGVLGRHTLPGVVIASTATLAGYVATLVIAARSAGVTATLGQLLPLALLILLAMTIPLSIAGWGPREGVAAWAFAAAGLGVDQGVATAVIYGVMVFVAALPGAALLLAARLDRRAVRLPRTETRGVARPIVAGTNGAGRA
ncbi:MAG: flippase-like domain-containing protein [Micrococcales bacterium]|nr:flippase-like domain-containing protein [Micrococcales bacterium]